MSKKKMKKIGKPRFYGENQDSMGKTNFFISTLPCSPRAILGTWLHARAPQKIHEK
jgi:hypothetical protein